MAERKEIELMEGPGAEYLVIFSDRQLREAQIREHSRIVRPRAAESASPRLTWIRNLISGGVTRLEAAHPSASEQLVPGGRQALFGSLD
jgi:hypothetical protein